MSPKEGGHDTFCELECSTWYRLGTGGEHVIHPGNWRRARDAVWELEGSTWYSLGTGGVHAIQPGNWRGHVMQVTHHKTYNKKLRYRSGTGQIYRKRYQPKFHWNRNSGRVLIYIYIYIFRYYETQDNCEELFGEAGLVYLPNSSKFDRQVFIIITSCRTVERKSTSKSCLILLLLYFQFYSHNYKEQAIDFINIYMYNINSYIIPVKVKKIINLINNHQRNSI